MPRSANITIRIDAHVLNRIDQAARMLGKSRSAFMVDLALQKAEALLPDLDQTQFQLNSVDFEQVMSLLVQDPNQKKLNSLLTQEDLPWAAK